MEIYIITLAVNLSVAFVSSYIHKGRTLYLWFSFIQLTLLGGLRGINVGTDTSAYHTIFIRVKNANSLASLWKMREEFGYLLLNKFVSLVSKHPQSIIFVTSLIISGGFLIFISKNSTNSYLSVFLLITLMFYFSSFNVIRQYIATVIILNGFKFIKEKKLIRYCLICILAASFHSTAILFVFLYFANFFSQNKKTVALTLFAILLLPFLTKPLLAITIKILPQQAHYLSSSYFTPYKGFMMPVLFGVSLLFSVFSYFNYSRDDDKVFNLWLIFLGLLFSLTMVGFFAIQLAHRIAWYLSPFVLLTIPTAIKYIPSKNQSSLVSLLIFVLGVSYFLYCLKSGWQDVVPYSFFWKV